MPEVARTAREMISGMTPIVQPGNFVFITTNDPALVASLSYEAISTFKEDEVVDAHPCRISRKIHAECGSANALHYAQRVFFARRGWAYRRRVKGTWGQWYPLQHDCSLSPRPCVCAIANVRPGSRNIDILTEPSVQ